MGMTLTDNISTANMSDSDKAKALSTVLATGLTIASMAVTGGASAYLTAAAMVVKAVGEIATRLASKSTAVETLKSDMQEKVKQDAPDKKDTPHP